jgi:splicing factor 3A subunit 3
MDSIIELQRQNHAEIERFQTALIDLLATPAQNHKEELSNQHRAAQILNRIQSRYHTLDGQYKDQDGREKESELLSSSEQSDDLTQFYARLVKIKDHHRKYPDSVADGFQLELNGILEAGYHPDDGEAEVEIEDRKSCSFGSILHLTVATQPLRFSSREKKRTAAISTYMETIPLTITSSTSKSD